MHVTVEKFQSNSAYATEEKAAWPLDSAPMGIKAEPAAKILHSVLQILSSGLHGFRIHIFQLSKFFHFSPLLILVPVILAWHNSQHNRWPKVLCQH